ncbi:hypothetical protein GR160_14435 [Flavobacterium sp. Sd200]|uniref:hypothetical protein n=1 Tax=Flavobacterium sp. Sd200 TaxID=2692211 RepID=UPI001371FBA9|nr:hypothetical protein [Flavobacterium sp. Sd200]MXN92423.1 hypothetical protein [Flavobacterium sp. Sd200]
MKKQLFLYLFIFSLIINVFTYMYFTNKQKYEDKRIADMQHKVKTVQDSLKANAALIDEADYFSLEHNSNAVQYFAGTDIKKLNIAIRDAVYKQNSNPNGNPLAQYPPAEGRAFTINKFKVLNNRWIIADFTNGMQWGEVIIKYFVESDGSITFENGLTNLHPFTPY